MVEGSLILPPELLLHVFQFLPLSSLVECSYVCCDWYQLTCEDSVWFPFWNGLALSSCDPVRPHLLSKIDCIDSYKNIYISLLTLQRNWKLGWYQHFCSTSLSAVLSVSLCDNILFTGNLNTAIHMFDLSQDTLEVEKASVQSVVGLADIVETEVQLTKDIYIPPHQRNTSTPTYVPPKVQENEKMNRASSLPVSCTVTDHMDSIIHLKYHAEKNMLFSCSNDASIRVWNVNQNEEKKIETKCLHTLRGHTRSIRSFDTYFPENNDVILAASGSKDATVRIWNVKEEKELLQLPRGGAVHCIQFSDGIVASGDAGGYLNVYDVNTEKQILNFTASGKWVTSVFFDIASHLIFAAGSDGKTRVYDFRTNSSIGAFYDADRQQRGSINSLAVDVSRNLLINGGPDINGYDIRKPTVHIPLFLYPGGNNVWTNVLALKGETLVSGQNSGSIRIYDTSFVTDPVPPKVIQLTTQSILSLDVNDHKIAAGTWGGECHLLNFYHTFSL